MEPPDSCHRDHPLDRSRGTRTSTHPASRNAGPREMPAPPAPVSTGVRPSARHRGAVIGLSRPRLPKERPPGPRPAASGRQRFRRPGIRTPTHPLPASPLPERLGRPGPRPCYTYGFHLAGRRYRLGVRTGGSQPSNRGSNPRSGTTPAGCSSFGAGRGAPTLPMEARRQAPSGCALSSVDRATGYEPVGRVFESPRARHSSSGPTVRALPRCTEEEAPNA